MSKDWRDKAISDFCKQNDVEILVTDEWKTFQKKIVMRKGNGRSTRYIDYDFLSTPTFLITPLLNGMLKEIETTT